MPVAARPPPRWGGPLTGGARRGPSRWHGQPCLHDGGAKAPELVPAEEIAKESEQR